MNHRKVMYASVEELYIAQGKREARKRLWKRCAFGAYATVFLTLGLYLWWPAIELAFTP